MVRGPSGKRGNDKVAPIAVVPGRPADGTATGAAPRVYLPRPAVEIGSEVDGVGAWYALADEIVATFVGRRRVGTDAAPVVTVRIAVKGRRIRDDDRVAVGSRACQDRPHHVVHVVDVDILVDDGDGLGPGRLDAQDRHQHLARMPLVLLLDL